MIDEVFVHGCESMVFPAGRRARCFSTAREAVKAVEDASAEVLMLCDGHLVDLVDFKAELPDADLVHAGLHFGLGSDFAPALSGTRNWLFLDPDPAIRSFSWKAGADAFVVRPEAVRAVGGFDLGYASVAATVSDLAYRLMMAGGRVVHEPGILGGPPPANRGRQIPEEDLLLFLGRHLGWNVARYAALWGRLLGQISNPVLSMRRARIRAASMKPPRFSRVPVGSFRLLSRDRVRKVGEFSAVIPTLGRYDYLPGAVDGLLAEEPSPVEVIVVDQTPRFGRREDVYDRFPQDRVKVLYLDTAGQALARNAGLKDVKTEWCFLFDDDSVPRDGMLKQHVDVIEHSHADVSTGASLAPWKTDEHLPIELRHCRQSDVLDTGNALAKVSSLMKIGGFDRAYDKGSGADNDLGMRLYLSGGEIIFNPMAMRTHFKATSGGLRTHGASWRERTGLWQPFPPPTQVYNVRRFYPKCARIPLHVLSFITARRRNNLPELAWLWLNAPWKLPLAIRRSNRLKTSTFNNRIANHER